MLEKMIDAHVHVASTRFIPMAFIEASLDNMLAALRANGAAVTRERLLAMGLPRFQDHRADKFAEDMDRAGVSQAVLLLPDFTVTPGKSPLTIEEMMREHHEILKHHPGKFIFFAGVDPRRGKEGVDLLQKAVQEYQCRGFKIYPPCGYSPSDPMLYPFYEVCEAYGLPVMTHTGPTSPCLSFNEAHPSLIDKAAMDFPRVNFILAHGGVVQTEAAINMAAYRPNVYIDISAYPGLLHPKGIREHLEDVFALGINHKIIFGTDTPVFNLRAPYEELLAYVAGPDGAAEELSDAEQELLFFKNIERLLPPERATAPADTGEK